MSSKELVLKYFHSWQQPADFEEMKSCLSEDFTIDGGFFKFDSIDDFSGFLEENPTPWKDVTLLSSAFYDDKSFLLYEGVNTATEQKMRVSEHIRIRDGKIKDVQSVITQLP